MLTNPGTRRAFDLAAEPPRVREAYGLGHRGQCYLLGRKLIESGVRLVTLVTGRRIDQAWDTHRDHFPLLKQSLLPPFDRSFAALLDDFVERRLFDDTLLVVLTEFGRTPKLGYATSGAGATKNGRDHWPYCYTAFFAGAGVPAGAVVGASDKTAAYPKEVPVTPADVAATVYALLGVDPATEVRDGQGRPYTLSPGRPIPGLIG